MKKILFVLGVAAALAVSCGQNKKSAKPAVEIQPLDSIEIKYAPTMELGVQAPDFTAQDTTGKDISLSDFKGSYLAIDFGASWCPDCRDEAPVFKAIYEEFKDKTINGAPIEFLSLSFDHDKDAWKKFIEEEGMVWHNASTLIKWKQNPISDLFQIKWIPTFYVIAPDGTIIGSSIKAFRVKEVLLSAEK